MKTDFSKCIVRIFLAVFVSALPSIAIATTLDREEVPCPVCGTKVMVYSIGSTNNMGGQDSDFMTRALGHQPLLRVPAACPNCLFADLGEDFKKQVPDELKKKIQGEKPLKLPEKDLDGKPFNPGIAEFPAWVKYDLIAQTGLLKGRTPEETGWTYLRAAWATRMETHCFDSIYKTLDKTAINKVQQSIPPREGKGRNPSVMRLLLAGDLLRKIPEFSPEMKTAAVVMTAMLLRDHGENQVLLDSFPLLKSAFPEKDWSALEQSVMSNIGIEREFQRKARAALEEAYEKGGTKGKPHVVLYLQAELSRRLGEKEKAAALFEKLLQDPEAIKMGGPMFIDMNEIHENFGRGPVVSLPKNVPAAPASGTK